MPYEAGRLDRRIRLSKYAPTRSATGAEIAGYAFYAEVPASYRPIALRKGDESNRGGEMQGMRYVQFTVRYRRDVKFTDQIQYEGRDYDIQDVAEPFGTRREILEIIAKLRQA